MAKKKCSWDKINWDWVRIPASGGWKIIWHASRFSLFITKINEAHGTYYNSMQAHGQEETFIGHNLVGWSSNLHSAVVCGGSVVLPVLTQKGWYCFVTNKTIEFFFWVKTNLLKHGNGKHLEYSIGSPTFFEWKCLEPLNQWFSTFFMRRPILQPNLT